MRLNLVLHPTLRYIESRRIRISYYVTRQPKVYIYMTIGVYSCFTLIVDTLVSISGRSAFRDPTDGSWFIQTVCDVLLRDGRKLEFKECMTRVDLLVSFYRESLGQKQSPCFISTMTKSLYFY